MATPSIRVIQALRETADKIEKSNQYQWGHMGVCNCGYLAQTITHLSKSEIHSYAMRKSGDWAEQVHDYCPTSGMPFDLLISEMINSGFSREDLIDLERLSNNLILERLPEKRFLNHNQKKDVVLYMQIWADLLESKLVIESKEEAVLEEEMIIF